MFSFGVKAKDMKRGFFDRVMSKAERARKRVLEKQLAYLRRVAKNSIKTVAKDHPKSSDVGKPPFSRTRLLKDFIYYAYDRVTRSGVVGPAALNGKRGRGAPKALEEGGPSVIKVKRNGRFVLLSVYIQPRPYMSAAYDKCEDKLEGFWKNQIK